MIRREHLQEIRDTARVHPGNYEEARYQYGLAHGHREVLLKELDVALGLLRSIEKKRSAATRAAVRHYLQTLEPPAPSNVEVI